MLRTFGARPRISLTVAAVVLLSLATASADAQQSELRGRLVSENGRTPVPGVQVLLSGLDHVAITDSLGRFRFAQLSAGLHVLVLRRDGIPTDSFRFQLFEDEVLVRDFAARVQANVMALGPTAIAQTAGRRIVTGTVTDSTGAPVPYPSIYMSGVQKSVGDGSGQVRLELESTRKSDLDFRRIGYRAVTVTLPPGGDTALTVRLAPNAYSLAAVRVAESQVKTLEIRGFYDRMRDREKGLNRGQFVTAEEIERRNAMRPTQLIEDKLSVRVMRVGSCNVTIACWVALGPDGCRMGVYLNGQRLMPEGSTGTATSKLLNPPNPGNVVYIDALIPASHLAGIEVYSSGPGAPREYQLLNGSCGVILFWTR